MHLHLLLVAMQIIYTNGFDGYDDNDSKNEEVNDLLLNLRIHIQIPKLLQLRQQNIEI